MSPVKQKSKDKQIARDRKASAARQMANGSASAYNPLSGTFHTLDSTSTETGVGYLNGRFKSIVEDDDGASWNGGTTELECMSNNGSCSGESEDLKERHASGKAGFNGGIVGGADKREKVRGKNERKHQRQKERRAQELRDKCTGYLMSRKLESLSQQLVAMGFSQERATMALIFNDGRVEQSVAWLLEGGESQVQEDWNAGTNPKIDISEELGRIHEIENKYKFSRPEIERAIVSCEGDLNKALESLRTQCQSSSPTPDEGSKPQSGPKDSIRSEPHAAAAAAAVLHSQGGNPSRTNGILQQAYQLRRDERLTIQSAKPKAQTSSTIASTSPEALSKDTSHTAKVLNPVTDFPNPVLPSERRGYAQGARIPLAPTGFSPPYTSHFPPVPKHDSGIVFGDPKLTNAPTMTSILTTASKDPIHSRQFVQTSIPTVAPSNNIPVMSSTPAFSPSSWGHSLVDIGSPHGVLYANPSQNDVIAKVVNARKKSTETFETGRAEMQSHYNAMGSIQLEHPASHQRGSSSWIGNGMTSNESSPRHSQSSAAPTYGLFTGWGSGLSHSSVDWSTGPMPNFDYRNIDWSMNASPTPTIHHHRVSRSLNSFTLQERERQYWNKGEERGFQRESLTNQMGVWKVGSSSASQENTSGGSGNTSHEWTSPFAGKDLFNLPQAVPSPSL